jgi:hypothetical protein
LKCHSACSTYKQERDIKETKGNKEGIKMEEMMNMRMKNIFLKCHSGCRTYKLARKREI